MLSLAFGCLVALLVFSLSGADCRYRRSIVKLILRRARVCSEWSLALVPSLAALQPERVFRRLVLVVLLMVVSQLGLYSQSSSSDSDWFQLDLRVDESESLDWGGLTLVSSAGWTVSDSNPNEFVTSGLVGFSDVLYFDGTITADTEGSSIVGTGSVFIRENRVGEADQDWEIINGTFGLSIVDGRIVFDVSSGLGELTLAGYDFTLPGFSVVEVNGVDGLEFNAELEPFKDVFPEAGVTAAVGLRADPNGFGFSAKTEIEKMNLGALQFRNTLFEIRYRDPELNYSTLIVAETTVWPSFIGFGVTGSLELFDGKLNRIGLGAEPSIPPGWAVPFFGPPPVLYVQGIYGEVANISDDKPWAIRLGRYNDANELTGGLEVTVGPQYLGKFAAKMTGSGEWVSSGRMNLAGDFYVYSDDWRFARAEFNLVPWSRASLSASFSKEIETDFAKLGFEVLGKASLDTSGSVKGKFSGKVEGSSKFVPMDFSASRAMYLSISLAEKGEVPSNYIATDFEVGWVYVSALFDFDKQSLEFPSNVDLRAEFLAEDRLQGGGYSILSDSGRTLGFLADGTYLLLCDINESGSYLLTLNSDSDLSGVVLVNPQGDVLEPDGGRVTRIEQAGTGLVYAVVLDGSELGEWRFQLPDTFSDPDATVAYMKLSDPLDLTSLTVSEEPDGSYLIEWEDSELEGGSVELLLTESGSLSDSMSIYRVESQDLANSYLWEPSDDLVGTFKLMAMIEGAEQVPGVLLAEDSISLAGGVALEAPVFSSIAGSEGRIVADWRDVQRATGYEFEYRSQNDPDLNGVEALLASLVDVEAFAGHDYRIRARAFEETVSEEGSVFDFGGWSAWNEISVGVVSGENSPPILGTLPLKAKVGEAYSATVSASDPDQEEVTLSGLSLPEGMVVGSGGTVSWTPTLEQLGNNLVRISASDGLEGGVAEREYSILVFEETSDEDVDSAFGLIPNSASLGNASFTGTFLVEAPAEDSEWSCSASADWVEILSQGEGDVFVGNRSVRFSILDNNTFESRAATIELSDGSVFSIEQEGIPYGPLLVTDEAGGATIVLDGSVELGPSPLQVLQMPVGSYQLTAYKEGVLFEKGTLEVEVVRGSGASVEFAIADRTFTPDYSSWLAEHFTVIERSDLQIVGASSDPDLDGSDNLFERLALLDPKDPQSRFHLHVSGDSPLKVDFWPLRAGVSFSVELSLDLENWDTLPESFYSLTGEKLTVLVGEDVGEAFYRVVLRGDTGEIATGASAQ